MFQTYDDANAIIRKLMVIIDDPFIWDFIEQKTVTWFL